jgi:hypothetical protein
MSDRLTFYNKDSNFGQGKQAEHHFWDRESQTCFDEARYSDDAQPAVQISKPVA